ncbi:MAG TPA: hypothetical protein VK090_02465 [Paracoccaceae bacterium]|nr:hypothetical protein [Paracoccaceae bacterium]
MRTLIMTTAVALLIGGAAHAADETTGTAGMPGDQTADLSQTFSTWDTDKDEYLTREEYEAGVQAHPTPEDFPSWDALDAAHADPQGRLLLRDSEKWYPASAITRGTSDDLGGGASGDDADGMGGAGTDGTDGTGANGAGDNGTGDGTGGGDTGGDAGGADGGGDAGDGADGGDGGAGAGGGT